MELTEHQEEILSNLLSSKEKLVFLSGAAGTGKTATISKWMESLSFNANIALCSSTHKALSVLDSFITEDVECNVVKATIHSFLGLQMVNKGQKQVLKASGKSKYMKFNPNYIILDEASMICTTVMKELNHYMTMHQNLEKVIFVGDILQLSISGDWIRWDNIDTYYLTQQMRKSPDDPMLLYINELRRKISDLDPDIDPFPEDIPNLIIHEDHKTFCQAYKNDLTPSKALVAYKNATVNAYNRNIKKYIHNDDNTWTKGDNIIIEGVVYKKVGKINKTIFTNRASLKIITHPELKILDGVEYWSFVGQDANKVKNEVRVPVTKTSLNNAIEKYVTTRDWRRYYEVKEKFVFAKHSYALTCHSGQGSTYENVYIDVDDFLDIPADPLNNGLFRMLNVGITRAKEKVHVYIGEDRNYTNFK